MFKKIISIVSMLVAIVLMVIPYGVAMKFASSPTERVTLYYSYFDMIPFGYGNWFPIITAVLSIIIVLVLLIDSKRFNLKKVIKVLMSIGILSIILSWLTFDTFTFISLLILIIYIFVLAFRLLSERQETIKRNLKTKSRKRNKKKRH